jgi:hypothetical protein
MKFISKAMQKGFLAFERLNLDVSIVQAVNDSRSLKISSLSHSIYDGNNGFWKFISENGAEHIQPPSIKIRAALSFFEKLDQYFRVLHQFKKTSCTFKSNVSELIETKAHEPTVSMNKQQNTKNQSVQNIGLADFFGNSMYFETYTEDETEQAKKIAQTKGTSLNSWMLWCANSILSPYLEGTSPSSWIVPVSVYESLDELKQTGVLTSIVEINIETNMTTQEVGDLVRKEVNAGLHWGTIFGACVNWFLPLYIYSLILKATVAKKVRVGTFSNIGKWTTTTMESQKNFYFCPPVHKGQPLGIGVNEFNGRLNIGWKSDASLNLQSLHLSHLHKAFKQLSLGK